MVRFSGPAFAGVDNRLMSLQLVAQGLGRAAMFGADGEVLQPAEEFYKRAVLIEHAFISNPNEAVMLRDRPLDFAAADARGILKYIQEVQNA